MNKQMIIVLSIVGLLLISPVIFASVSTVSTSMSTSRATTGTSVTGTVTVTATGSESGSVQLSCSPSGVTISDPSSGQYQGVSLSTSPTSKTFTFTAGTANTYTCTGQSSGVTGDSTIVFVDPSALSVTGTPTSKSTTSGSTFALSVNLQNSQSSAITTSYALSLPLGYSASGDSTPSTVTVAAGTTTALTWTVTVGGTSSSSTITFSLGDTSNAFSTSVSCSNCTTTTTETTTTTTAATTSTQQDITFTTQKGKVAIKIPLISPGSSKLITIPTTEDVSFTEMTIYAKNTMSNTWVNVTKLESKPTNISQDVTGKVYHYVQVEKNVADTSINKTSIKFKVEKTWMSTNNVNESTIALYRYDNNAWSKLNTSKTGDDTTYTFYEATSSGLSVFAISGELKTTITPPPEEIAPGEKNETTQGKLAYKGSTWWIIVIILVVVTVAGGIFYLVKTNVVKIGKLLPKKSPGWDELKKKYRG